MTELRLLSSPIPTVTGPGPGPGPGVRFAGARLRFAVAPVRSSSPAALPGEGALDLPRSEGLDLLDWLGLGRPEFGAISARDLAPRCRRRLWAVARNEHPSLQARTAMLLSVAEAAGQGTVIFG